MYITKKQTQLEGENDYEIQKVLAIFALAAVLAGSSVAPTLSVNAQAAVTQDVVPKADGWYYTENGEVVKTDTVAKNKNGWWVIRDGKVDFTYNGFAENQNGWWYCKGGKVHLMSTASFREP